MTITMYGAQWCGDCRRAKKFFDDNEIEFTYVNLEDDPEQTKVVLERNGGVKRIPVIVFPDDSHLVEPSNDELAKKMAELSETGGTAGSDDGLNVVRNSDAGRFELFDGTELLSFASYSMRDNTVVIPHVETVPAHRGNGHAARLLGCARSLLDAFGTTLSITIFWPPAEPVRPRLGLNNSA